MLSIRFSPAKEWWVSNEVFERVFKVGLAENDIPSALAEWQDIADANGGFGLADESAETAETLTNGILSAARKELDRVSARLADADEKDHPHEWTYRESLKKLLALGL